MTPQEKELIQNVANKLKQSPEKTKDQDAETLIKDEIGSQQDAIYKLTQAVLVQEMALKELKQKNDYLEKCVEHHKSEANRGTLSKMMGGNRPAPQPPQPAHQPSAFGSFMQTAASVAVGMVAGNMISNALFNNDDGAAADSLASAADSASSFLDDSTGGFASDYTDGSTGGFGDAGFNDSSDGGFGSAGFDDDTLANNSDDSLFGGGGDFFGGDEGFGGDDFGDFDDV